MGGRLESVWSGDQLGVHLVTVAAVAAAVGVVVMR
jgi:hypothetical protein